MAIKCVILFFIILGFLGTTVEFLLSREKVMVEPGK